MNLDIITPELYQLRRDFQSSGFDIRLVGGVVRDMVKGHTPKDIDLCTDADPEEQLKIYSRHGYNHHLTGFEHGTITVVLNDVPYEITSLRLDVATDGRRATVAYTRDWIEDLKRRDLTFNAMSLTFDGELIDPFDGRYDLENGLINFVGDPHERIKEDYLRILRWYRFAGRYSKSIPTDSPAVLAIQMERAGLDNISRERVWAEIKAILKHESAPEVLNAFLHDRVGPYINIAGSSRYSSGLMREVMRITKAPELLMYAFFGWDTAFINEISNKWKWSNAEKDHVNWFVENLYMDRDLRYLIAVEEAPREWVAELAAIEHRDAWEQQALVHWVFDPFPVNGNDLIERGCKPGKEMGKLLHNLKEQWAKRGYVSTKDELLSTLV